MNRAWNGMAAFMYEFVATRQEEFRGMTDEEGQRGDIFSRLVAATNVTGKLGLDEQEVLPTSQIGNTFTLLFAGHESTACGLAATLGFLAIHQDEQQKAYEETLQTIPATPVGALIAVRLWMIFLSCLIFSPVFTSPWVAVQNVASENAAARENDVEPKPKGLAALQHTVVPERVADHAHPERAVVVHDVVAPLNIIKLKHNDGLPAAGPAMHRASAKVIRSWMATTTGSAGRCDLTKFLPVYAEKIRMSQRIGFEIPTPTNQCAITSMPPHSKTLNTGAVSETRSTSTPTTARHTAGKCRGRVGQPSLTVPVFSRFNLPAMQRSIANYDEPEASIEDWSSLSVCLRL
ncbi:hypothetical protein DFH06DRAFT_1145351 [Mycena polygramma]|nr:hypothetical protein DFH06DRAFT_1145351 [Mycena polygramma]